MADKTGVARLRQAIENQRDAGEACFTLPIGEAYAICDEVEDELVRGSWAEGVPLPRDADGEVVPLTTRAMYDEDGKCFKVNRFTYSVVQTMPSLKWGVVFMDCRYDYCSSFYLTSPETPDSWERLEADIESSSHRESACCYFGHGNDISCDVCPASSTTTSCAMCVLQDVMRRAKALAGRDAKEADRG